MIENGTKITSSDILAYTNGQDLLDKLEELIPYFSSITFYGNYFIVTISHGYDSIDLGFRDLDLDFKVKYTVHLGKIGLFIEVSFNDIMNLMVSWRRDNKLKQLGL